MKAILYSTGCPRCKILKQKLEEENISYEINEDVDEMRSLGIMTVPVLKVGDKLYNFSEVIQNIKEIQQRVED